MNLNLSNIRNFCIIAHIDHGKSTLADRFLELTNTIEKKNMHDQYLDTMGLEQERGITIKLQPVLMTYNFNNVSYNLNLIDTPGHTDFSYEVSRALSAVEGAILIVDAVKGVQAQTVFNFKKAKKQGLYIIPAVNKIDMPGADIIKVKEQIKKLTNSDYEILEISAKTGFGVKKLLERVIELVPQPKILLREQTTEQKSLIFDSSYDSFKGIIAYARIFSGIIKQGQKLILASNNRVFEVKEVGIFSPDLKPIKELKNGEIGYIATGIKEADVVKIGDSIISEGSVALLGFKEPNPNVFASFYPEEAGGFDLLKISLQKLKLSDPALSWENTESPMLGRGFRVGFLGKLHLEIVGERLKRELDSNVILGSPMVAYKVNGSIITSPNNFPDNTDLEYLDYDSILLKYEIPLSVIITENFFDRLKSATSGFASADYEFIEYRKSNAQKLSLLVAGDLVDAFSTIVKADKAYKIGKIKVEKLKKILPMQQFTVSIQAISQGNIIARADVSARRKDVTAPLYGGDVTRKNKLLEKQKKGKKRLKLFGKVKIPKEVFSKMI
ncbi:MAG: GTP-binding protein LepA [Parcubacteria group bacterium GW2011_GWA2_31_28]|nr:MAG: GTP-binding protein LepA [Parcubacteria group bacterium GW2011_GWA2_31_28]